MSYSYYTMICLLKTSLHQRLLISGVLGLYMVYVLSSAQCLLYDGHSMKNSNERVLLGNTEIFTIYFAVYLHYKIITYYAEILGTFSGGLLNLILCFKNRTYKRELDKRNSMKILSRALVTMIRNKMHIKIFLKYTGVPKNVYT